MKVIPVSPAAAAPSVPLALTSGGALDLTFIGAGSAFSKKYYQTNLLVAKGGDHVLVDCGGRAPEALAALGVGITAIGCFLITHTHADHIGGLEEAMLMNRYMAKKKARIVISDKLKRILWEQSLRGGCSWNEARDGVPLGFDDFWDRVPVKRERGADRELAFAQVGGLELGIFRTKHIPDSALSWEDSFPSYGVLLDRRVLFTSDTRFDPELVASMDEAYKLEAIFHDCQFFPGGVHAFMDDLGTLPPAIKAKTFLMHYGDAMESKREAAAALGFAGFARQWSTYSFD